MYTVSVHTNELAHTRVRTHERVHTYTSTHCCKCELKNLIFRIIMLNFDLLFEFMRVLGKNRYFFLEIYEEAKKPDKPRMRTG